jgi:hypothetical protein
MTEGGRNDCFLHGYRFEEGCATYEPRSACGMAGAGKADFGVEGNDETPSLLLE